MVISSSFNGVFARYNKWCILSEFIAHNPRKQYFALGLYSWPVFSHIICHFLGVSKEGERHRRLLPHMGRIRDGLWAGCRWTLAGEREDPLSDIAEEVHAESGPVGLGGEYGLRRIRSLPRPGRRHPLPALSWSISRKCRWGETYYFTIVLSPTIRYKCLIQDILRRYSDYHISLVIYQGNLPYHFQLARLHLLLKLFVMCSPLPSVNKTKNVVHASVTWQLLRPNRMGLW